MADFCASLSAGKALPKRFAASASIHSRPGSTILPSAPAAGISAAFKSTGRFYVTGKYGYRYIATSLRELDDDRSGNGFAFGVGYRWGKGHSGVELAYKELAEDVESIGLTFFVRAPRR